MGIAPSSRAASLPSAEQAAGPNTSPQQPSQTSNHIETTATHFDIPIESFDRSAMNDQSDNDRIAQGQLISDANEQRSDASSTSWNSESENQQRRVVNDEPNASDIIVDTEQMIRRPEREADGNQSLAEFKEELRLKREQRISAIADLKNEVIRLRQDLAMEREISQQLRAKQIESLPDQEHVSNNDCDTTDHSSAMMSDNDDDVSTALNQMASAEGSSAADAVATTTTALRAQLADVNHELQLANAENLSVSTELTITRLQVASLKEVIVVTKEMVAIRESQLEQLKAKLKIIEDSLAERELSLMSDTLRREYDRQLANIRSLRTLYEERSRVNAAEKENLIRQLDTKRTEMEAEIEKSANLESRVAALEKELEVATTNLSHVKDDLLDSNSANKSLQADSAVINQLFSQLLSGFRGGNDLNIDKLAIMLEDNRDLLSDITNREISHNGSAALPKLLFDLVSQVEDNESQETAALREAESSGEASGVEQRNDCVVSKVSPQEIVNNLPKVWKVLIELLNHQKTEPVPFTEHGDSEDCYNLVQSPTGPQQVLSVSKTYIRLKDLIVEKKSLQKETHKLKNLNSHLETRLDQQEKRLATVTVELNKTWTLVGRMQRQHRQLHTHEQVLRYQLSQKRRMLNELKEELEYCRRKWNLAREKNDESQIQWDTLRREFTARKLQDSGSQNSAESGFSDDPVSDDEGSEIAITSTDVAEKQFEVPVIVAQPVLLQDAQILTKNGEASGSGISKLQLSAELRKKKPKKVRTKSNAETLEDMFYRISGLDPPEESSSEESEDEDELLEEQVAELSTLVAIPEEIICFTDEVATQSQTPEPEIEIVSDFMDPEDEERRQRRAERFQRLEEQCAQLINQVMKTATRGNELNKQLDDVHNRYRTPTREQAGSSTTTSFDEGASTSASFDEGASTSATVPSDNDTSCLTEKEQEFVSRRAARLKRLEDECKAFLNKVNATNDKGTDLNTKLDTLHDQHSARLSERKSLSKGSSTDGGGTTTIESVSYSVQNDNESHCLDETTVTSSFENLSVPRTEIDGRLIREIDNSSPTNATIDVSRVIESADDQTTSDPTGTGVTELTQENTSFRISETNQPRPDENPLEIAEMVQSQDASNVPQTHQPAENLSNSTSTEKPQSTNDQ